MKRHIYKLSLLLLLVSFGLMSTAQAQNVADNPNYDSDIALVTGYLDDIMSGDFSAMEARLHANFMRYGPAESDSSTATETLASWKETHQTYSGIEIGYVAHSWRVTEGDLMGDWVAIWGTYEADHKALGKTISLPFHYVSMVSNGKMVMARTYFDNIGPVTQLGGTVTMPGQ